MKTALKMLALVAIMAAVPSQAQAQKIGHVDLDSIMRAMPERDTVILQLQGIYADWQTQLGSLENNLQTKYADFEKKSQSTTTSPKMLEVLKQELQDLEKKYQSTQQYAQEDIQTQQVELMKPLQAKAKALVELVAKEKGYTYVMDSNLFVVSTKADDLTPLVIKRLK